MWDTLTSVPESGDVLNGFSIFTMLVFGAAFLLAAVFSARPWIPPVGNVYSRRFIRRSATILGWISGIGLFFLLIRFLQINPASLGLPIWSAVTLVAMLVALVYIGYASIRDREIRRLNKSGHRASNLKHRPARKAR